MSQPLLPRPKKWLIFEKIGQKLFMLSTFVGVGIFIAAIVENSLYAGWATSQIVILFGSMASQLCDAIYNPLSKSAKTLDYPRCRWFYSSVFVEISRFVQIITLFLVAPLIYFSYKYSKSNVSLLKLLFFLIFAALSVRIVAYVYALCLSQKRAFIKSVPLILGSVLVFRITSFFNPDLWLLCFFGSLLCTIYGVYLCYRNYVEYPIQEFFEPEVKDVAANNKLA